MYFDAFIAATHGDTLQLPTTPNITMNWKSNMIWQWRTIKINHKIPAARPHKSSINVKFYSASPHLLRSQRHKEITEAITYHFDKKYGSNQHRSKWAFWNTGSEPFPIWIISNAFVHFQIISMINQTIGCRLFCVCLSLGLGLGLGTVSKLRTEEQWRQRE